MITAAAVALFFAAAEGGWEVARDDGKTLVERRPRPDGFFELRASTVTDVSPRTIADTFWSRRVRGVSALKMYTVLGQSENEKVVYQQLKLPVVKDRDYTLRMKRYVDLEHQLY